MKQIRQLRKELKFAQQRVGSCERIIANLRGDLQTEKAKFEASLKDREMRKLEIQTEALKALASMVDAAAHGVQFVSRQ